MSCTLIMPRMAVLGLHEAVDLYAVDTATYRFTPLRHPDTVGRELIEDAISYYDGADVVYRNGSFQNPAFVVTSH